jgi:hypothetical protein
MVHPAATLMGTRVRPMPAGLPVAFMLFAQAASAGAGAPPAPKPAPTEASAAAGMRECMAANADPKATQIVVCAPRPQGYRIDPDVLAARRMKKKGDPGQPRNPHETFADHSCATVGPMGCRGGPGFDVVTAAATAVTMVQKAVKGENVGKELVTDPQQNEYQLYLTARAEREAKEAEAAAKKAKAAASAAPAARQ